MKIELINCTPKTYRSEDGKDMVVMNANLTLDGLAAKLNEVIRHVNGLEVSVEALANSIPPKSPVRFEIETRETPISKKIEELTGQVLVEKQNRMMTHFKTAIMMMKTIAFADSKNAIDLREDPRNLGCTIGVRMLAQLAMDEIQMALQEDNK